MTRSRSIFSIALVGSLVVALAPIGGAAPPQDKGDRTCEVLDGKYENGTWENGIAASGISVTSFSEESVTFEIAEGWTLLGLCVKSGRELNVYNSNAELPVDGLATIALTKYGPGYGIGHVSFDTDVTPPVECPEPQPPAITFAEPQYIDEDRAGGEPVSVVAQDGSISVSAHAGTTHIYKDPNALREPSDFVEGYFNQTLTWRSTDGGATWRYIGLAGLDDPEDPRQGIGPHSATSTGFSDPDYAMDQAGNIYNVEIDLANVAVFKSEDDGQTYMKANPEAWFGDRPWLTALEEDEVFLYVNLPRAMLKSVDGGLTWVPVESSPQGFVGVINNVRTPISPVITSKAIPDPKNEDNGLIGPIGVGSFAFGTENDADIDNPVAPKIDWTTRSFGNFGPVTQFFGAVAADRAGNVYQAAAGGYSGGTDTIPWEGPNGGPFGGEPPTRSKVTFGYFDRDGATFDAVKDDQGVENKGVVDIPTPPGDALWPWVVAGDDGRVAVVWYQNIATGTRTVSYERQNGQQVPPYTREVPAFLPGEEERFYVFVAVTHNAYGTTVECTDGTSYYVPPRFTVVNASQRPIFVGNICLNGTNCNANTSFKRGDRRLGDFFTVNFDHEGNLFIVSADTMILNDLGFQKPVGNPIFIKQNSGERMLLQPDPIRPTRCLFDVC